MKKKISALVVTILIILSANYICTPARAGDDKGKVSVDTTYTWVNVKTTLANIRAGKKALEDQLLKSPQYQQLISAEYFYSQLKDDSIRVKK